MQQQSLELENREIESLKKRVYDLELELAVHQKECEMRDKSIQEKLKEISEKEAETKSEVIESRKEMNERFKKVNEKFWIGLSTLAALALTLATWSFNQLWTDHQPRHDTHYEIVRVYKI